MERVHQARSSFHACWSLGLLATVVCLTGVSVADETVTAERYEKEIKPILAARCFGCHADGAEEGGVSFDRFQSAKDFGQGHELWWRVLKNVRGEIMPPEGEEKLAPEEVAALSQWIKRDALQLDAENPDPGRVTLRRLNRVEYANTIRDLMGVQFRADEEFPPDDTGYGFDNIGDVLGISPLLLEKYLQAARTIVAKGVPTVNKVLPVRRINGRELTDAEKKVRANQLSFYEPAKVGYKFHVANPGDYRLVLELRVRGEFNFDPGECKVTLKLDGEERLNQKFVWQEGRLQEFPIDQKLEPGEHEILLELEPLTPVEKKVNSLNLRVEAVRIEGPSDQKFWAKTEGYSRFFSREEPPTDAQERRDYARELLTKFASRAFRRPVEDEVVGRLVQLAESIYTEPGRRFEEGVAESMVAVLCSPRFLFRMEEVDPSAPADAKYAPVDEYSLASRLSYFLWSTMPDDELIELAAKGELRKNLQSQVDRMLKHERSKALVSNFPGQWLQIRDLEGASIDVRSVLRGERRGGRNNPNRGRPNVEFDRDLKLAMLAETERYFEHILREDESLLKLIDSDFTFLNERLAKHYEIPDVTGNELRKVTLPADSPRGGILTQGSVLVVTSNPTRTSPVKRGLFILDNVLGTPPPPPPPDIPELESAAKDIEGREPTVRELMALHAADAACNSCHSRMDPLGLALENFNALGMFRDRERGELIDPAGKLITGEEFANVTELKKVITGDRREDFYRCFTEKLLTYALGRGLEYYDVQAVDNIVAQLENEGGKFSVVIAGIVDSAPFRKVRRVEDETATVAESSN